MKIKLVAFDWNGTILSDAKATAEAESKTREHFGLQPTNLKEFQEQFTIPIKEYWIKCGFDSKIFDENSDEIFQTFLQHYEPGEAKFRTRTGTKELLKWLHQNQILSVIFSNHIIPHIEKQLNRLKIHTFDDVLARRTGDNSHMHGRGKGQKLFDYTLAKNLKAREIMVIGDTIEEIDIGKEYGFISVAITGGYQSTPRLKAAKPDYLVHNLQDIKKIIQEIN